MNGVKLQRYHAPVWGEPVIMQQGSPGERGIAVPQTDPSISKAVGPVTEYLPTQMLREEPPRLPEISQPQVLRHYLRLSQQILGQDEAIDISTGTATMKYGPKVNDQVANGHKVADIHPFQDEETIQGLLEIVYRFERICCEISGMDAFSFQPGGGAQATFTHAAVLRAYFEARGELEQRTEIINTFFSHPSDSASPTTAGFKVVVLMPGETGYAPIEAVKAACSERTAGIMMTNHDDTGIYNPLVDQYVDAVHAVGGLAFNDQANLNGLLGLARSGDAGFDACHFNLHKTFSSPKACLGPAAGAYGVKDVLKPYLPAPLVTFDGERYHLSDESDATIGKVREFLGNLEVVLKSYAWSVSVGPEGLRSASTTSILNNNYLSKLLLSIRGISRPYDGEWRMDQARFSLEQVQEETGIDTFDVQRRMVDYGIPNYFASHHPFAVPEPFTPEPCETYSKADCDYWASVIERVVEEAYEEPEIVKSAPHRSTVHALDYGPLTEFSKMALSWRRYRQMTESE